VTVRLDSAPAVVVVDGAWKRFRLPQQRTHTLKERALHPFRRARFDELDALRDISFAVRRGEFFGVVGRNGSGKSTLLKCLAGIYKLDRGEIRVDGRLSTFIELGVGFNPDLAARDNIVLNAIMLGLTPREARERVDRVLEFAELEEFEELKLKNYSSGMHVRLAFSVMIQVDADIMLIDEVLAVGDAAFQQKCFDVFQGLRDSGKTILFVTHDMGAVERFCDRAMLLEHGVSRMIDEPRRVAAHYLELNFGRDRPVSADATIAEERFGDQTAEVTEAWFEDEHGDRAGTLRQGRPCTFRARVRFNVETENPAVAVLFENDQHHPLFASSTDIVADRTGKTGRYGPGDEVLFSVGFENPFAPGRVHASPWVVHRGGRDVMDRRPRMLNVIVTGLHGAGGLVDLPHDVTLEHSQGTLTARAGI
jgi:ABC-type polysaccharide/polyol phosphate transport system ATPase subunit